MQDVCERCVCVTSPSLIIHTHTHNHTQSENKFVELALPSTFMSVLGIELPCLEDLTYFQLLNHLAAKSIS